MIAKLILRRLGDWDETHGTLHAYALAVSALPRAHGEPLPRHQHLSLLVVPRGLVSKEIPLPDGGRFRIRMDLQEHLVAFEGDASAEFDMTKGLTGTEFAETLIAEAGRLGLQGEYLREKFENDAPRQYVPEEAERFFDVLLTVNRLFEMHRATLPGEPGPVQLWPHGFDLAFEWFGTKVATYEGEEHPSQLNLGLVSGGRAYFYSNPWPFDREALVGTPLPSGAEWFSDGWEGTILYYDRLAGDPNGPQKLLDYARAVFEVTSPTLLA